MTGKTHQIIGLTVGVGTYLLANDPHYAPATCAWVVVASSLGSLLPDIDSPTAEIWRQIPLGKVAGELVNPFLQHRNLTHSILGFMAVAYLFHSLLQLFPNYWGIDIQAVQMAGLSAYGSHLIADMLTVQGIPLLFPAQRTFGIPPRPLQGLRIETGKWFENLVVFPVVTVLLMALILTHLNNITKILFHS